MKKNNNVLAGIRCPACASLQPFKIVAKALFMVHDDGTDDYSDVEWESTSNITCCSCSKSGTVSEFKTKVVEKQLILPAAEIAFARKILQRETAHPDYGTADVIKTYTVDFENGIQCDIKICNGDGPYIDPVLFHNGEEVQTVQDPSETLEGEYEFNYEGTFYCVEIVPEERSA